MMINFTQMLLILITILLICNVIINSITLYSKKHSFTSTTPNPSTNNDLIEYSKNYLEYDEYFNKRIQSLVDNEIETKVVIDKMSGTSTISDKELLSLRDTLEEDFYASIPNGFNDIINKMYLPNQIKLMISNTLYKKVQMYYKIFSSKI